MDQKNIENGLELEEEPEEDIHLDTAKTTL